MDSFEKWWTKHYGNMLPDTMGALRNAFKDIAKAAYCEGYDDGHEDGQALITSGWNQ